MAWRVLRLWQFFRFGTSALTRVYANLKSSNGFAGRRFRRFCRESGINALTCTWFCRLLPPHYYIRFKKAKWGAFKKIFHPLSFYIIFRGQTLHDWKKFLATEFYLPTSLKEKARGLDETFFAKRLNNKKIRLHLNASGFLMRPSLFLLF